MEGEMQHEWGYKMQCTIMQPSCNLTKACGAHKESSVWVRYLEHDIVVLI